MYLNQTELNLWASPSSSTTLSPPPARGKLLPLRLLGVAICDKPACARELAVTAKQQQEVYAYRQQQRLLIKLYNLLWLSVQ